ncbi:polysaccharide biosynthesis tyrosine autokinase [Enterobacter sp. RHBSTW-01064]|uniref:polysaccharide biosynthesis tyrosine autokinase n=1 Tax=Enterobacter sp. RHBSTW-01064 TaxID=2742679 RepID=UPI0015FB6E9A|nr:polysaccharide biosynthesis tyrosine autokinase [Enterobacter sp. RHBSTW-01064]MBA7754034.1 polysaccharide biosynthesis tyrosine autokinase [Enterobacter sp. RHBSTW-01064]
MYNKHVSNPPPDPVQREEDIDIVQILKVLFYSKVWIAATTILFIIMGIIIANISTPVYRSDALIQVEKNSSLSILNKLSTMLPEGSGVSSESEVSILKSRLVMGKTVRDLKLDIVAREKTYPVANATLQRLLGHEPATLDIAYLSVPDKWMNTPLNLDIAVSGDFALHVGDSVVKGKVGVPVQASGIELLIASAKLTENTAFIVTKRNEYSVIEEIKERVSIDTKSGGNGMLHLSMIGPDPVTISQILDSIAQNYLAQDVERKSAEASKSLAFLNKQLLQIKSNLVNAESKLNEFRKNNESVDLSLEAKFILDNVVSIDTQLNELTFKEAEISKLYKRTHPAYKALSEKKAILVAEKEKLNQRISAMPSTQQEILSMTRDVQMGNDIYMILLNKQHELNISKASTLGNVRIIDHAVTQQKPVKPKKILIVLLSALIGFLFSSGVILVRNMLIKGIRQPAELERRGIPVLAVVPLAPELTKRRRCRAIPTYQSDELLAKSTPTSLAVEALRGLRTSLHFAMLKSDNKILMISGTSPGVGKSFVSSNLAVLMAQAGTRVLLIDCDLRRGYLHRVFSAAENGAGLADYLSQDVNISTVIQHTEYPEVDFIGRGRMTNNPAELFMSEKFKTLLTSCSTQYDVIIIDTPPILSVTDAAIVGRYASTSLMVVRFEQNSLKEVEAGLRRFDQNGIAIQGTIFNGVEKRAAEPYTYGDYSYQE